MLMMAQATAWGGNAQVPLFSGLPVCVLVSYGANNIAPDNTELHLINCKTNFQINFDFAPNKLNKRQGSALPRRLEFALLASGLFHLAPVLRSLGFLAR
jgi:hypothetical protein